MSRRQAGTVEQKSPSALGGAMIIAGTAVGAGMFSLPLVSSGMWFGWSLIFMVTTWFFMFHSSLMILEVNLHYPVGSSFDTFVRDILGRGWNLLNGISIAFVLYIVTYAYISGGSSIVILSLQSLFGTAPTPMISSLLFAIPLACIVSINTKAVSRIATLLLAAMVLTFFIAIADLAVGITPAVLLNTGEENTPYFPFVFAALPFFMTSFGFHGNVPSLVKYYGKQPLKIRSCLLYGSLLSLVIFLLWQASVLGNIPRPDFKQLVADGGNMGVLITALSHAASGKWMATLLNLFANFAIISSFLGVTLGLFDYIADLFNFDDSPGGRTKTALVTFVPPTLGGVFFPDGFLYAIGFAGLAATVLGGIIPALTVRKCRSRFADSQYRVWGGNKLVYLVIVYAVLVASCHILALLGWLPVYGQ
ncbi:MAG: tryptophan permease [Halioglobus sp.]